MKRCNVCNREYKGNIHYCKNCGKNLTDTIEKSDILLFFYRFNIILACFNILFTWVVISISSLEEAFFGKYSYETYILIAIIIYLILSGFIMENKFKKICKENLKK